MTRQIKSTSKNIVKYIDAIFYIITVTLLISWLLYDSFDFWDEPFSNFGSTVNRQGNSNALVMLLYSTGMILCGVFMFLVGKEFKSNHDISYRRAKYLLSMITGTGFIISIYPHNINNFIHSIGSALMTAGLFFLTNVFFYEVREIMKFWEYLIYIALFVSTILIYAFLYMINSPAKQVAQKFAFISLIIIVKVLNGKLKSHLERFSKRHISNL